MCEQYEVRTFQAENCIQIHINNNNLLTSAMTLDEFIRFVFFKFETLYFTFP